MTEHDPLNQSNHGTVISVRGSVIDAHFPKRLPHIHNLLRTGDNGRIAVEVETHLSSEVIRGVALTVTRGLALGSQVIDTGRPLHVPVGKHLLGRMFNLFGEPIDRKGEIKGGEWRSVYRDPVPISQRATTPEIFETGIKAIDVLAPMERGGKAGLFGGAGVGKTVIITEMIHNIVGMQR